MWVDDHLETRGIQRHDAFERCDYSVASMSCDLLLQDPNDTLSPPYGASLRERRNTSETPHGRRETPILCSTYQNCSGSVVSVVVEAMVRVGRTHGSYCRWSYKSNACVREMLLI